MHDFTNILSDREHRRELRREVAANRRAAEARGGRGAASAGEGEEPAQATGETRQQRTREEGDHP